MTGHPQLDREQLSRLDPLIPPPWPRTRRRRVTALVVLGLAGLTALIASGVVGPQLGWDAAAGWETRGTLEGPVHASRDIGVVNQGWVPATLHAVDLPALDGVQWDEVTGLPADVEPGQSHTITVSFTVSSCSVDLDGYNQLPVRASSGIAPARVIALTPPRIQDPNTRTSITPIDGRPLVVPAWPRQAPSWILDTIRSACETPPEAG